MAIIDRIKYDGPENGASWLVHKYPSEEFVLGSQLIVNGSQEVLFFQGGEAVDLFGPGTHTLKTGNLPLLNKLVNLPFGGKTPFTAEAYYINMTSNLSMNWGTSNPIPFEDPKYGLILSIRSHGQYGVSIYDSRLFISQLIGAIPNGAWTNHLIISRYFNGIINTKIKDITARFMIKNKISFLEVTAYLEELSAAYKLAIEDEFKAFGIEIINFTVDAISPPKEEYEKLRQYKEELALGEGFYKQRRSFDVLEKFGENASGGMTTVGMDMGIGLGVGTMLRETLSSVGMQNPIQQESKISGGTVCHNCHEKVAEGAKFCGVCGTLVQQKQVCPHCNAQMQPGMNFCGECGGSLNHLKCSRCGEEQAPGMKFCGNCGEKLGGR